MTNTRPSGSEMQASSAAQMRWLLNTGQRLPKMQNAWGQRRGSSSVATVVLCPKCGGQKHVNKPPYVAGDQPTWVANNTGGYRCPVCNGTGWIYA